jgi:hypothetical protein
MSPDASTRARFSRKITRVPLRYGLRYGRVTQSNDAQAVSIWIPPARLLSMMGLIRCGMLAMPFQIGFGSYSRFRGAPWTKVGKDEQNGCLARLKSGSEGFGGLATPGLKPGVVVHDRRCCPLAPPAEPVGTCRQACPLITAAASVGTCHEACPVIGNGGIRRDMPPEPALA